MAYFRRPLSDCDPDSIRKRIRPIRTLSHTHGQHAHSLVTGKTCPHPHIRACVVSHERSVLEAERNDGSDGILSFEARRGVDCDGGAGGAGGA
eukprot:6707881-Prymnesium_polylepis.1